MPSCYVPKDMGVTVYRVVFIDQKDAGLTNGILSMVVLRPCSCLTRASNQEGNCKRIAKLSDMKFSPGNKRNEAPRKAWPPQPACLGEHHPLCLPGDPIQATAILRAVASSSAE